MTTTTLGIDPGGAHTGFVYLDGYVVIDHGVIDRRDGQDIDRYAVHVAKTLLTVMEDDMLVCVEGLVRVTPQMRSRPIDLFPTVEAGVVFGAVVQGAHDAGWQLQVVRPGGHGSSPLGAYPDVLVGARETKGTGRLRHARSAYDVALAGRTLHRIGDAA